jgi:S-adenosylmethionine decarboxylase
VRADDGLPAASGVEWLVEAHGCPVERLCDLPLLESLFARLIHDLDLHPCADAQWRQFEHTGGITGLTMLAESHLACHSFPEFGVLCLNVFCCRPRPDWDFARHLHDIVGARSVVVRRIDRAYQVHPAAETAAVSGFSRQGRADG